MIAANLARVREAVNSAAHAAGRNADDVKLIAVSKTHPIELVESALQAGQTAFGENTVQEALGKIAHFKSRNLEWHFIGYLQSNKAKFVPANFTWLHSLDSAKLAQRLSRLAQEKNAIVNALIEVNITRDPNKHGVVGDDLFPLLDQLLRHEMPGISLRGLMTMGPYDAPEAETRAAYANLRHLRDQCVARFALPRFTELSMGMSGDYAEAIKEGSTMVRIGTAIFGERRYSD